MIINEFSFDLGTGETSVSTLDLKGQDKMLVNGEHVGYSFDESGVYLNTTDLSAAYLDLEYREGTFFITGINNTDFESEAKKMILNWLDSREELLCK